MFVFVLYYLVLPLAIIWSVQAFFKRRPKPAPPPAILRLYAQHPVEKGFFRAIRLDIAPGSEPVLLGDFETQPEAVDAAYADRERMRREGGGRKAAFLVLNDAAEPLEEIDL